MNTALQTADGLHVDGLTAGFGPVPYVHDVSFDVEPGQVFALLGANGAGKTTTLMAVAGHLKASSGSVRVGDVVQRGGMDRRARDGFAIVTQSRCVFMDLTVLENLRLGRGDINVALDMFPELKDHVSRRVGLLSGGQQQMLAVARALAGRPRVLLADELSLGLAPLIVERLLQTIRSAADEQGTAVVLVEQHLTQALEYADLGAVLHRGRVSIQGSVDELAARSDEIIAEYL